MNGELRVGFLSEPPACDGALLEQDVLLVPGGVCETRDGVTLLCDEQGGASVEKDFAEHGVDIPFDINHATVLKASQGERADAYGWGTELRYVDGKGVMCHVQWTEEGREEIRKGHYKYLSPVILYEEDTGRVRRIHSVALVTKPALPRMPALAASELFPSTRRTNMKGLIKRLLQAEAPVVATAEQKMGELKSLLEGMGVELGDAADFVAIINAAIAKLKGGGEEKPSEEGKEETKEETKEEVAVAASVRETLGLAKGADKKLVLRALSDLQGKAVAGKDQAATLARVATLEEAAATRDANDLVEKYLSEGKLLQSNEERMKWAREFAKRDAEGFKLCMDEQPAIVPQGRTTPPAGPASRPSGVDEDKLLEKALSEHEGNHKKALIALQAGLMQEHTDAGLTKKAARERCARTHPKIFGAAA